MTSPRTTLKATVPYRLTEPSYVDYANEAVPQKDDKSSNVQRPGVRLPVFPRKLFQMLESTEQNGQSHIVSWQPHGRCFIIHQKAEFIKLVQPYFNIGKMASFQRQCNLYGFKRINTGPDRGGLYHELFLRGRPHLIPRIKRVMTKNGGMRPLMCPEQEPNFWQMPWMRRLSLKPSQSTVSVASTSPCSSPVSCNGKPSWPPAPQALVDSFPGLTTALVRSTAAYIVSDEEFDQAIDEVLGDSQGMEELDLEHCTGLTLSM